MIKFRAWDKETNKYFEPTYQAYMGRLEELTIALSGRLQKRTCRGMVDESVFPGRYVVEQFTGLTDVNGKDIYEGDVLRTKAGLIQIVEQGILETDREDIISGFYANNLSDGKPHTFSYDDEVIGNVHENAELLEVRE
ncbi:YopX family protein [Lactiplantibacillus plantarum]|uniref:YopX family protein n=1 Tax=Lactiplantibacillus plantarum TaxID=1590 RepID=UPI0009B57FB2|nr:YopX family protein [Lactiplantibacillus plantarum]MDR7676895.1 YopX family protein [Lactiplantibacillus plantarum]